MVRVCHPQNPVFLLIPKHRNKLSDRKGNTIYFKIASCLALGKLFGIFVYFAVQICHQFTLPSVTPSFLFGKSLENQQKKHQRRRGAWVGQADFGKLELNNRNHGGNCQHDIIM